MIKMDEYESWKSKNESILVQEFIEDYEDMFEEYCKNKYTGKQK